VLLAGLPPDAFDQYLEHLTPIAFTNRTVVDKDALRERVSVVMRQGYSTTVDELDYGITALAVPIRNRAGRHVAAVNSSGYSGLVSADQLVRERLGELSAAATRLSAQFDRYPMLESLLGQG
jgi:IclR family transcriptional regulator, pca regulon regulatory protein